MLTVRLSLILHQSQEGVQLVLSTASLLTQWHHKHIGIIKHILVAIQHCLYWIPLRRKKAFIGCIARMCAWSQIVRFREKISAAVSNDGVNVDPEDLKDMAEKSRDEIHKTYPEGSFERVFWEEQDKAMSLSNVRSMRWHQVFIKWSLYLWHLSGWAYERLQMLYPGIICLCFHAGSSSRPLANCSSPSTGFTVNKRHHITWTYKS